MTPLSSEQHCETEEMQHNAWYVKHTVNNSLQLMHRQHGNFLCGLLVVLLSTTANAQPNSSETQPTNQPTNTSPQTDNTTTTATVSEQQTLRDIDARDGVVVPTWMRSVRITRGGEVLRSAPSGDAPRRGTAALGARLPALEAALGPGCLTRWIRVGPSAWVCQQWVEQSRDEPEAIALPVVPTGEITPYTYAFATYAGVRTYYRPEDAETEHWVEELEQGMGVAVDGSARVDGNLWVHTASDRWILQRDLRWARPSSRQGVLYEQNETLESVGFIRRRVYVYAQADHVGSRARNVRPTGFLLERTPVHIRERVTLGRRHLVRTDAGWLTEEAIRLPNVDLSRLPTLRNNNERWVDVDLQRQLLVAFEGNRPVFVTLVSTGRGAHRTGRGEFRVWVKLATSDMSNADDASITEVANVYSVERVPWVMFFHNDQALHGVYWHDGFGAPRSHGCVNLAPRDARWIFQWAPPLLPVGWEAVFPTAEEPGLLVRVR